MPNFTARVTNGAAAVPWVDPATGSAPSRLNPLAAHLPRYLKATPGVSVVVSAKVGGVEGPLDAALGGELFQAWLAEWSGPWAPVVTQPGGQTSVVTVALGAMHVGHFMLVLRRENGGAVVIHFDAEP